jgi:hypothetical protein
MRVPSPMSSLGSPPARLRALLIAALLGRAGLVPAPPTVRASAVTGTVLDAASSQPLVGAHVVLEPAGATPGEFQAPIRTAVTDDAGRYRFDNVATGAYRLQVRAIGYRATRLDLQLPAFSEFRLSVGLDLQPILLTPISVDAPGTALGRGARGALGGTEDVGRVALERYRQERYLSSDVRGLTEADMVEAITLGETDLLRTFQRLPGVTTRDDFTAQLWTRGARWTETRVYYDGLPLFNPFHAAGMFSAVPPDAVGAGFFHPGVRTAALGEGAAAALELSSRTAGDTTWAGTAELSVLSARVAIDRRLAGGRAGILVAARRSYADLVSASIPYAFHDLASRLDVPVGERSAVEVSGLWAEDALRGDVRDLLQQNRGRWGNLMGRVSLVTPVGSAQMRHSVGASRFAMHLRLLPDSGRLSTDTTASHEPVDNRLSYVTVGGDVAPSAPGRLAWRAGYEIVQQSLSYFGGPPTPYARTAPIGALYRGADSIGSASGGFALAGRLAVLALWGEGRGTLLDRVTAQAGVRVEGGRAVRNAGPIRVAPRVLLRYDPTDRGLTLTAGWGRSYQYTQTIAPTGPRIGPDLHLTDVWLLAGDSVPAIRSDVVTAGAEWWIADAWLGAVNVYGRWASGVTEPDPTPGYLLRPRPPFVVASTYARGMDVAIRRLSGRVSLSLAFSIGRSEVKADTFTYPARSERRRSLDATAMARVGGGLRLGGALTAATGSPFTRFYSSLPRCDSVPGCLIPSVPWHWPAWAEEPSRARTPTYASLDLLADWTWTRRAFELGAYLQVRNATNWRNAVTYIGSRPGPDGCQCDRFERGLPVLPLAGVRVAF